MVGLNHLGVGGLVGYGVDYVEDGGFVGSKMEWAEGELEVNVGLR